MLVVIASILLIAGCSASSPSLAGPASQTASASASASEDASTAALAVSSSIADGAVVTDRVPWIATVTGASASDAIDRVDFSIDGAVTWTEHNAPYQFNDDGNLLIPSVLTPGTHQLGIDAVTASGAYVTTASTVTTSRAPVPEQLLDKGFIRSMPAGGPTPAGDWRIKFDADGVISIDEPGGDGTTEAFIATSNGELSLYAQANWIVPEIKRGGLCEPEGIASMHWQLQGSDLVLSPVGKDSCAARASLFAGTWMPKP